MRQVRFSLRQFLVLIAVVAVLLALIGKRAVDARQQRQLIALIQSYGGETHHELNFTGTPERTIRIPNMEFSPSLPGPDWLRNLVGDEYFVSVSEVFFDRPSHRVLDDLMFAEMTAELDSRNLPRPPGLVFSDLPITDKTLEQLANYPDLTSLHIINCPAVTDDGLQHLKSHKTLRRLELSGCSITDTGLANLSDLVELRELSLSRTAISDAALAHLEELHKLEWLALSDTAVTSDGAKAPKTHLPKCTISR